MMKRGKVFARVAISVLLIASPPLGADIVHAADMAVPKPKSTPAPAPAPAPAPNTLLPADGSEKYNIARVTAHNFVETWSSLRGDVIQIRATVSNGDGGFLGRGPFAPIVTLAFSLNGKSTGSLRLLFNLPASKRDETYTIKIPDHSGLWLQSDHIEASAANDLDPKPTPGTWEVQGKYGSFPPFVIHFPH